MSNFKTLSPDEVLEELERDKVTLVDVRTPAEHESGHIPNSLLIPLQTFTESYSGKLSEDDQIIVYCQHGVRSKQAATFLAARGFTNVSHMLGGMAAWTGPVEPE